MNVLRFRFQFAYTALAILVLGLFFVIVSTVLILPLTEPNSTESRLLFALLGISILMLVDPVRRYIVQTVQRMVRQKPIKYEAVKQELTSLFLEQVDLFETTEHLTRILQQAFSVDRVELVIRKSGSYYRIREQSEIRVDEDVLLHHLVECDISDAELYMHNGRMKSEKHAHGKLEKYCTESEIVYVMPLFIDQKLFGYITLHHANHSLRLLENDREFLRSIRSLISVALRRVHTDRKLNNRIEELEMLNRISYTMNSSLNVQETIEVVMDAVIELTHADRAIMYLRDDDEIHFTPVIGRGIEDVTLNFSVKAEESIFSHVVRTREAITVEHPMNDSRVNKEHAARVRTKAFVIAPMMINEEVIGIIGVDNLHSGRSVAGIDVDLLMTLANQVAIALSNSRHHEKVQKFNEELQIRIEAATEDLQRMVDTQSHFLTVASHQLRTPTTVVRGLLSMILEDPHMSEEETKKYTQQAFQSMTHLQRIISELLSATELDGKALQPLIETVAVKDLVNDIVSELVSMAADRGISLIADMEAMPDIIIQTDRFRLHEAVSNLVDNAIRYTIKGTVRVDVTQQDDTVSFAVTDTGVGLTSEDKDIIFDKFQRGATITDIAPNGSGLGLFIAQKITEILKGSITAESKGKDMGSVFTINVPVHLRKEND